MDGINLSKAPVAQGNPRSTFDLSFKRKLDGKFGDLIPVLMQPTMPGDKFYINTEVLMRMAPFVQQVFQDFFVNLNFYYVPNRVLWHNFDKFLTGGWNGQTKYINPYFNLQSDEISHFVLESAPYGWLDYLDVPFSYVEDPDLPLNALPIAAYARCVLDYNLPAAQTPLSVLREKYANEAILVDGDCTKPLMDLMLQLMTNNPNANTGLVDQGAAYAFGCPQCLYPLDYFTMGRPDPQLGPVMTIPMNLVSTDTQGNQTFVLQQNADAGGAQSLYAATTAGSDKIRFYVNIPNNGNRITVNGSIFNNTATINDFYSAARLQELLTLYGFTGYSAADKVAAEFNVNNPNSSLQKAQLLHHDSMQVGIGEVFSSDVNIGSSQNPVTDIPGAGTAIAKLNQSSRGFEFECSEHGYLVGLLSCYPEAGYQNGLPRHMTLSDRFDYPHPKLAELGMRSVKFREVDTRFGSNVDDEDFCYLPPYSDYKVNVNRVNGALKNNLSSMVATRKWPENGFVLAFNDRFLKVDPTENGLNRVFNVQSNLPTDKPLFFDLKFNIRANRELPYYGLPKY